MARQRATLERDRLNGTPGLDPTAEGKYWADNYHTSPYVEKGAPYESYEPAYRYGWESYVRYPGRKFDDLEAELLWGWDQHRGASLQTWEEAKAAARDAWCRVEQAIPGDADGDGR